MARLPVSLVVVVSALAAVAAAQQQDVFRGAGDTVRVFVTATDKDHHILTNLTRDQFEVKDDGKPQPLTNFDNTPQPIRLIALLDVSGSMAGNLSLLREACEALFTRLRPDDAAKVGTFGDEITITPAFTRDARTLVSALPAFINPNSPTPMWRAMNDAMDAFGNEEARRVLLVLSDAKDADLGKFRRKIYSQLDIIERAQREDVLIYGVGLRSRPPGGMGMPMGAANIQQAMVETWPDPGLGKTAEETGGGYFELRPRDDLAATFSRVADELHNQYLLGYTPPKRDGKAHKIEVTVKAKDVKVQARRSYLAPKGAK